MIKMKSSKINVLLIELMINIAFFFILTTLCLKFFIKTEHLSKVSTDLHFAVCSCENIAAIYQSGDGSFSLLKRTYPCGITGEKEWTLYFNKQQKVCTSKEAYYTLKVIGQPKTESTGTLMEMTVQCEDDSGKLLHQIKVCHYTPLYIESEGGGGNG